MTLTRLMQVELAVQDLWIPKTDSYEKTRSVVKISLSFQLALPFRETTKMTNKLHFWNKKEPQMNVSKRKYLFSWNLRPFCTRPPTVVCCPLVTGRWLLATGSWLLRGAFSC
jgi:hypothetical protein